MVKTMAVSAVIEPPAERPYGSAARLATYLRDRGLTYEEFGRRVSPPVTKGAVSAWTHQRAVPTDAHRTQIEELSCGFVPRGGWAPTTRDVLDARELLARDTRVRTEVAAVEATRTLDRAERVRREVRPVPKADRQRWTRWQQSRLPL